MRDGVKLAVDYVMASGNERLPVILEVTPYGRGPAGVNYRYEAPFWYGHGYLVVVADCRGTGDSEGSMNFFAEEGRDGYDLIEWIARQPWSNGRVSMRGSSYTGTNQWLVAREQPPHLSCITPSATIGRSMEDFPYRNGAFGLHWALNWIGNDVNIAWPKPTSPPHPNPPDWLKHRPLQTMDVFVTGHELPLYRTFLEHPTYDDYWRRIDFTEADFAKIQIPALAFTGWFDGTMHGTIWRFQQARLHAARKADQFLIVGPYTHGNAADGGYNFMTGEPMLTVGDLAVATDAVLPGLNMTRDFFNWCLKDGPRPAWAPVRIFITGSDRWMSRDIFPPPEVQQRSLFLNSAGRLQWDAPQVASLDRYVYDPNNPLFMHNYSKPLALPVDMNALLDRDDVLIYTTVPMNQSLTVVGDVVIELTIFQFCTGHRFRRATDGRVARRTFDQVEFQSGHASPYSLSRWLRSRGADGARYTVSDPGDATRDRPHVPSAAPDSTCGHKQLLSVDQCESQYRWPNRY